MVTEHKRSINILPGDFRTYGAEFCGSDVIITFESEARGSVSVSANGVSDDCTVSVFLYHTPESNSPEEVILLDDSFRRGRLYSVRICDLDPERYGYYTICENDIERPDPYSKSVGGRDEWGKKPSCSLKSRFVRPVDPAYKKTDRNNDRVNIKPCEMVIYRAHLRGFTMGRQGASGAGDHEAFLRQLPYLKKLGINTIELAPVYDFDEMMGDGRINFWGYSDSFFLSPKASYFGGGDNVKNTFNFINTLKNNGFKVIIEFCFNNSDCEKLYLEAVCHWGFFYGVDGFSFIGAHVPKQTLCDNAMLCDKLMIFENTEDISFKAGQEHRIFCRDSSFMYAFRRLLNNMDGNINTFIGCVVRKGGEYGFINTVSSPTGFTLYDSVSYSEKHNEANGEDNRDGNNYNCISNNGAEGETKEKYVLQRREKSIRFALACLMLSRSVPYIPAGDEICNSAGGNNNPYCQDNETGWTVFSKKRFALAIKDYFSRLVEFRKNNSIIRDVKNSEKRQEPEDRIPDISFHGREPWMRVVNDGLKAVGIMFGGELIILFNFSNWEEEFSLPKPENKKTWHYVTNTATGDFYPEGKSEDAGSLVSVEAKSLTVLVTGNGSRESS